MRVPNLCGCTARTPVPFDNHSAGVSTIACVCVFTREEEGHFLRRSARGVARYTSDKLPHSGESGLFSDR